MTIRHHDPARLPTQQPKEPTMPSLNRDVVIIGAGASGLTAAHWGTEEWTRGAYAASFDLGGLSRYGADQRQPVGPIHFSCSDLAGKGYQHVDGAIRMGRRTAALICAAEDGKQDIRPEKGLGS
ncbi:FAD-dependent oxidoreductase [Pseudarthrobacter albicanus]|uniref:FAD-dependent oxidoreductase n=1 Tax=Pseudarthrobacter albicanus TaxID=2823873 RepID=UPI0027DB6667|nr:FAD-dependent oxidoreductase [Pseudarthrobacter albicanus]